MSTVTFSATATGAGSAINIRPGETGTYAVAGSFTATLKLQKNIGGSAWSTVATTTTTTSGILTEGIYRFLCTAYTTGTATCTLADVSTDIIESFGNEDGTKVQITETGIKADTVSELTSASGVTVDGVLLKDSAVQSGASGTAGSVSIYPATASKGKLSLTCTNQTGNTTVTVTAGAMGQASTITIPDPGDSADTFTLNDTTQTLTGKTLTSPVIASGLTASGSGNNNFGASTGPFTTSTGLNTLSGPTAFKMVTSVVAAAGSAYTDAAAVAAATVVLISSDSAAKGVRLPTAAGKYIMWVINTTATACKLYPYTGGTINGLSANAAVVVPASKGVLCICTNNTSNAWYAFDMAALATTA